jgi:hypothetical protein
LGGGSIDVGTPGGAATSVQIGSRNIRQVNLVNNSG